MAMLSQLSGRPTSAHLRAFGVSQYAQALRNGIHNFIHISFSLYHRGFAFIVISTTVIIDITDFDFIN